MRHPFLRTLAGASAAAPTDPNFENVTLLLHGDGTNGGQNNTFVDGSTNNFAITRNGNTTQGTFSPYGDRWSNYFDGTGDFLSSTAQGLGTGNWTIECWVFFQSFTNAGPFIFSFGSSINNRYSLWRNDTSGKFEFVTVNSGVSNAQAGTTVPAAGTWYHVAVVRSSGTTKLYVNGTSEATSTTAINNGAIWRIGYALGATANTFYLQGYISNFRVVTSAVYTANFTPPTSPLTSITDTALLTCQSNRIYDASFSQYEITRNGDVSVQRFSPFSPTAAYAAGTIGGSGYFDGTGDYLTVPDNATFDFGTGDFTIELWVYIAGNSALNNNSTRDVTVFGSFPTSIVGSLTNSWGFNITGNGTTTGVGLNFSNWQSGSNSVISATVTIPQTSWNHIAVARSGTTTKLFLNGAEVGSGTLSNQTVNSGQNLAVGRLGYPGYIQELNGYISNLRVLKGTAQYTGSYTIPTAPLTAITNTSFLLNFTNAAILDNAMMAVPETVGNAQIDTTTKKYGTGSLKFDGTGDYLTVPNNPAFSFGTGDFTIECWVYIAGNSSPDGGGNRTAGLFSAYAASGTVSRGYTFEIEGNASTTGTGLSFYNNNSGTQISVIATTTISQGTWHHVAVCRSGTTTRLFLNGSSVASGTLSNQNVNSDYPITIGRLGYASFLQEFNGYIDDLRVTKGFARYTSNFTPPTAAFPDL